MATHMQHNNHSCDTTRSTNNHSYDTTCSAKMAMATHTQHNDCSCNTTCHATMVTATHMLCNDRGCTICHAKIAMATPTWCKDSDHTSHTAQSVVFRVQAMISVRRVYSGFKCMVWPGLPTALLSTYMSKEIAWGLMIIWVKISDNSLCSTHICIVQARSSIQYSTCTSAIYHMVSITITAAILSLAYWGAKTSCTIKPSNHQTIKHWTVKLIAIEGPKPQTVVPAIILLPLRGQSLESSICLL